jgi:hypothetical protein
MGRETPLHWAGARKTHRFAGEIKPRPRPKPKGANGVVQFFFSHANPDFGQPDIGRNFHGPRKGNDFLWSWSLITTSATFQLSRFAIQQFGGTSQTIFQRRGRRDHFERGPRLERPLHARAPSVPPRWENPHRSTRERDGPPTPGFPRSRDLEPHDAGARLRPIQTPIQFPFGDELKFPINREAKSPRRGPLLHVKVQAAPAPVPQGAKRRAIVHKLFVERVLEARKTAAIFPHQTQKGARQIPVGIKPPILPLKSDPRRFSRSTARASSAPNRRLSQTNAPGARRMSVGEIGGRQTQRDRPNGGRWSQGEEGGWDPRNKKRHERNRPKHRRFGLGSGRGEGLPAPSGWLVRPPEGTTRCDTKFGDSPTGPRPRGIPRRGARPPGEIALAWLAIDEKPDLVRPRKSQAATPARVRSKRDKDKAASRCRRSACSWRSKSSSSWRRTWDR